MTTTTNENVSPKAARDYRAWVRGQAGADSGVRIEVVAGDAAPTVCGTGYRWTTKGGAPVHHPNAYRRAWGKPVYHCSTIRVEVGADWLAARRIPASAMRPAR